MPKRRSWASFAEEIAEQVGIRRKRRQPNCPSPSSNSNRAIIDAVADIVPPSNRRSPCTRRSDQPASTPSMTCEYAKQQGLYVPATSGGDIGSTAAAYAHHLSGGTREHAFDPWHEDAVTVNPYLGTDGITPFVEAATGADKDIFVLVRTSNPSSSELQELELASGERAYEHVAGPWKAGG